MTKTTKNILLLGTMLMGLGMFSGPSFAQSPAPVPTPLIVLAQQMQADGANLDDMRTELRNAGGATLSDAQISDVLLAAGVVDVTGAPIAVPGTRASLPSPIVLPLQGLTQTVVSHNGYSITPNGVISGPAGNLMGRVDFATGEQFDADGRIIPTHDRKFFNDLLAEVGVKPRAGAPLPTPIVSNQPTPAVNPDVLRVQQMYNNGMHPDEILSQLGWQWNDAAAIFVAAGLANPNGILLTPTRPLELTHISKLPQSGKVLIDDPIYYTQPVERPGLTPDRQHVSAPDTTGLASGSTAYVTPGTAESADLAKRMAKEQQAEAKTLSRVVKRVEDSTKAR